MVAEASVDTVDILSPRLSEAMTLQSPTAQSLRDVGCLSTLGLRSQISPTFFERKSTGHAAGRAESPIRLTADPWLHLQGFKETALHLFRASLTSAHQAFQISNTPGAVESFLPS